jgi:hypothetical protein
MRGFVMVLMTIDHASMAFDAHHLDHDSAAYADVGTMVLPAGVRENGPFYVFGQTAMFFYIAHRLAFEVPATWFGLRDFDGLGATYGIAAVALMLLYPACLWYRRVKAAHPQSILKYL